MKKTLSIILLTALLLCCAVVPAYAKSSSGGGGGSGVIASSISSAGTGITGTWYFNQTTGIWTFADSTGKRYSSEWGYLYNPYSNEHVKSQWFYFDENGTMLTGWVWIRGADGKARRYYLNPISNGSLGACQLGGTVTDTTGTWTLDSNGAWTVNGIVQER